MFLKHHQRNQNLVFKHLQAHKLQLTHAELPLQSFNIIQRLKKALFLFNRKLKVAQEM